MFYRREVLASLILLVLTTVAATTPANLACLDVGVSKVEHEMVPSARQTRSQNHSHDMRDWRLALVKVTRVEPVEAEFYYEDLQARAIEIEPIYEIEQTDGLVTLGLGVDSCKQGLVYRQVINAVPAHKGLVGLLVYCQSCRAGFISAIEKGGREDVKQGKSDKSNK